MFFSKQGSYSLAKAKPFNKFEPVFCIKFTNLKEDQDQAPTLPKRTISFFKCNKTSSEQKQSIKNLTQVYEKMLPQSLTTTHEKSFEPIYSTISEKNIIKYSCSNTASIHQKCIANWQHNPLYLNNSLYSMKNKINYFEQSLFTLKEDFARLLRQI